MASCRAKLATTITHELHVRQQPHLPDGARVAPRPKGAQQLGDHQGGEGRIAGSGEVVIDIPLIGKGAEGDASGEAADQDDALEKIPVDQLRLGAAWGARQHAGINRVGGQRQGRSPSVTRLIHNN